MPCAVGNFSWKDELDLSYLTVFVLLRTLLNPYRETNSFKIGEMDFFNFWESDNLFLSLFCLKTKLYLINCTQIEEYGPSVCF